MTPKNKQLLMTAIWVLLTILNLYRLLSGDFPLSEFRGILAVVATLSFAALSVDAFLKYRKL